jgi:putative MATE family efflux protein
LVFPFQTLMQMMAGGAIGGGVTSAVARALGGSDVPKAERVAWHAAVIALAMSMFFVLVLGLFSTPLFTLLGGEGEALDGAVAYARIAFGGAAVIWLLFVLSAVLRGTGDTVTPARAITVASIAQVALSGALTLGWGGLPALGIIGPAIALIICHGVAVLYLSAHLLNSGARVRLRPHRLKWSAVKDIMEVGGIGLVNSAFMAMNVIFVTGFIGRYGTEALAGYGLVARLELMLVPIAFGVGAALTAAVGANVGAGQFARARRIAWTGSAVTLVLTGTIGITVALIPSLWLDLFTESAGAYRIGALYLGIAAPFYGLFGAGQALYFASQGTGRMLWPVAATGVRFLVVVSLGALAVSYGWDVSAVFWAVAAGLTIMGIGQALSLFGPGWRPKR